MSDQFGGGPHDAGSGSGESYLLEMRTRDEMGRTIAKLREELATAKARIEKLEDVLRLLVRAETLAPTMKWIASEALAEGAE